MPYKISTVVITSGIETVCCISSMSEISTCDTTYQSGIAYYIGNIIICCIHQIISMQRRYSTTLESTNSSCCSCSGAFCQAYKPGYGNTGYYTMDDNDYNEFDKGKAFLIFPIQRHFLHLNFIGTNCETKRLSLHLSVTLKKPATLQV